MKVDRQHLIKIDYDRDEIIKKINSFFGYECVSKILINFEDIRSTQLSRKSLKLSEKTKKMLENLDDNLLKDKLLNFVERKKIMKKIKYNFNYFYNFTTCLFRKSCS